MDHFNPTEWPRYERSVDRFSSWTPGAIWLVLAAVAVGLGVLASLITP